MTQKLPCNEMTRAARLQSINPLACRYCGSCWAHGSLSALADRIKIARGARGIDIGLSVQYLLNCGARLAGGPLAFRPPPPEGARPPFGSFPTALPPYLHPFRPPSGSCHGGSALGAYYFAKSNGFIPYDTCLAYESCSADSSEGSCGADGRDYSCSSFNTCRTCSTFAAKGGFCSEVDAFPNATVAEYGRLIGEDAMKAEIFARGPIACSLNAEPLHTYKGGIYLDDDAEKHSNHLISLVGWGEEDGVAFWRGRNSWGARPAGSRAPSSGIMYTFPAARCAAARAGVHVLHHACTRCFFLASGGCQSSEGRRGAASRSAASRGEKGAARGEQRCRSRVARQEPEAARIRTRTGTRFRTRTQTRIRARSPG